MPPCPQWVLLAIMIVVELLANEGIFSHTFPIALRKWHVGKVRELLPLHLYQHPFNKPEAIVEDFIVLRILTPAAPQSISQVVTNVFTELVPEPFRFGGRAEEE